MTIAFATNNAHKLHEVRNALGNSFQVVSLKELSVNDELPEDHETLEENSLQKAHFVFDKTKNPCFADDSGLEVDALNGAPGVFSARYAGPQRNSDHNIELLLKNLLGGTNRSARFKTVIALVGYGQPKLFSGVLEGEIINQRRGSNGFGYDPVFKPRGHSKTLAEMSLDEKNQISHRAIAISKLCSYLKATAKD